MCLPDFFVSLFTLVVTLAILILFSVSTRRQLLLYSELLPSTHRSQLRVLWTVVLSMLSSSAWRSLTPGSRRALPGHSDTLQDTMLVGLHVHASLAVILLALTGKRECTVCTLYDMTKFRQQAGSVCNTSKYYILDSVHCTLQITMKNCMYSQLMQTLASRCKPLTRIKTTIKFYNSSFELCCLCTVHAFIPVYESMTVCMSIHCNYNYGGGGVIIIIVWLRYMY